MTQIEELIHNMNDWGRQKIPFLFAIDFDARRGFALRPEEADPASLLFSIGPYSNAVPTEAAFYERERNPPTLVKKPIDFEAYEKRFQAAQNEIFQGNSFLLNLTCPTPVEIDWSLRALFYRAKARYKLLLEDQFLVFSPETFVQIREGRIISCPMKGTIDASLPDAERRVLENPKEKAEHCTIVDLIRNDLGMVAKKVEVERFRYVERVQTQRGALLQVSSRIGGTLPRGYAGQIGSILLRLLPAGSISGAPKRKTVEIIRAAEQYERGFYTGVAGYFDGEGADVGVMIRFLEKTPDGLVFKSGGGITADSDARSEYLEMLEKVYVPVY